MKMKKRMVTMMVMVIVMMMTSSSSSLRSLLSTNKLIDIACKNTTVPDFCKKALEADPATRKASKTTELTKAAVELMIKNTTASRKFLERAEEESGGSSPPLKEALRKCVLEFSSAVLSFSDALFDLDQDPPSANYDLSTAGDYADACRDFLVGDSSHDGASFPVPSAVMDTVHTLFNFIEVGFWFTYPLS